MSYDNDTEYFKRPVQDNYNQSAYYSGYQQSYPSNPFSVESRRYDYNPYNGAPGTIPPYNPEPQYIPQQNVGSYDGYQRYNSQAPTYFNSTYPPTSYQSPSYTGGYQYGNGAPGTIPPYNPSSESRRNDGYGIGTSLFNEYKGYSAPINTPNTERRQIPSNYTGPAPYNGFNNMYTQPPVPSDPQINWSSYGPGKTPDKVCVSATWTNPAMPQIFEAKHDTWEDIYKRNFNNLEL